MRKKYLFSKKNSNRYVWVRRKDTSKTNTVTKKAYLLQVVKEMSKSTAVTLKLISKETCQNSSHFFPFYFSLLKDMHNAGQILIYG